MKILIELTDRVNEGLKYFMAGRKDYPDDYILNKEEAEEILGMVVEELMLSKERYIKRMSKKRRG